MEHMLNLSQTRLADLKVRHHTDSLGYHLSPAFQTCPRPDMSCCWVAEDVTACQAWPAFSYSDSACLMRRSQSGRPQSKWSLSGRVGMQACTIARAGPDFRPKVTKPTWELEATSKLTAHEV